MKTKNTLYSLFTVCILVFILGLLYPSLGEIMNVMVILSKHADDPWAFVNIFCILLFCILIFTSVYYIPFIFSSLHEKIRKEFQLKMMQIEGVNNRNKIRNTYKYTRNCCMLLSGMLPVSGVYLLERIVRGSFIYSSIYFIYISFLLLGLYIDHSSPISHKTVYALKDKKFNLYLRGFCQDNYYRPDEIQGSSLLTNLCRAIIYAGNPWTFFIAYCISKHKKKELSALHFYEHLFAKYTKRLGKLVAVGMSHELDAPQGAQRIYLDEKKWKADVSVLMRQASHIFILINGRANCLYETTIAISQYLEKTVFIIDTAKDYQNLLISLEETHCEHNLPKIESNRLPAYLFMKNGKWIILPFWEDTFKDKTKELIKEISRNSC